MEDILKLSEDGKTVIGVNDKTITHITIPNSVTTIRKYAFSGCSSLQSIDIPNSVTTIGDSAFCGCSLQSIDIPNSVKTIRYEAFRGCSSLHSIHIAKENEHYASIDGVLFSKELTTIIKLPIGKKITEYNIPNSVETIGKWAFWGCSSIQSINIPNSVKTIEQEAFLGCSSLQSIDIPNSVKTIGNSAFRGCSSLQRINIPNSVTTIEHKINHGSNAIKSKSVKTIFIQPILTTFRDSSLHSIDIPNRVKYIVRGAFYGCSSLHSIHISITDIENVDIINEDTFDEIDTDNCVLYVPPGTRWAYRHHPIFSKFKNIEIEKQK